MSLPASSAPEPAGTGVPAGAAGDPVAVPPRTPMPSGAVPVPGARLNRWVGLLAVVALAMAGLLWQKLAGIQEQLARQSADAGTQAVEARAVARAAQELARDTAARLAVAEARLSEVALQRTQLEELMQSLSRSRDENLVVDIESAVRLAQQQAQLTGSLEPLLAALRTAEQRVGRAAQPRLAPLQRAIGRDIERLKAATVTDLPSLMTRVDELVRLVDDLPLANDPVAPGAAARGGAGKAPPAPDWWVPVLERVAAEARGLVRVSRIERPEAALLSPEQGFFLRENLKLKLLNARLALLARQMEPARADLGAVGTLIGRYFDAGARRTQAATQLLQQVQTQLRAVELPRVDGTLTALATAAAGR